jgi:hypothetical protein
MLHLYKRTFFLYRLLVVEGLLEVVKHGWYKLFNPDLCVIILTTKRLIEHEPMKPNH